MKSSVISWGRGAGGDLASTTPDPGYNNEIYYDFTALVQTAATRTHTGKEEPEDLRGHSGREQSHTTSTTTTPLQSTPHCDPVDEGYRGRINRCSCRPCPERLRDIAMLVVATWSLCPRCGDCLMCPKVESDIPCVVAGLGVGGRLLLLLKGLHVLGFVSFSVFLGCLAPRLGLRSPIVAVVVVGAPRVFVGLLRGTPFIWHRRVPAPVLVLVLL